MADLLIKGMKMPQNCDECNFVRMESEFHGICTAIRNDVCYVYPDKGKPEWCPLVEVPAHGRLIDADVLYEKTAEWEAQALHQVGVSDEWKKWSIILTERTAFKYDIADAATVIEASGDGK